MGAAESPRRRDEGPRRRREDSRERDVRGHARDRSRERSRERSHRDRDREGSDRHRNGGRESSRDRPASTSGREQQQQHGSSRQPEQHRDRDRDRRHDGERHEREDSRRQQHNGSSRPPADRRDNDRDRERDRSGDAAGRSSRGVRQEEQPQHHHHHHAGSSRQRDEPGRQRQRQDEPGGDGQQGGRPRWGKPEEWAAEEAAAAAPAVVKEGPNLGLSGKLAAETNKTADGQSELKFQAPPEARVCRKPAWLLYVFKGSETVGEPLPLTQLPYYLFGKDRKVADIPTDHPSCSRQHAVVVFREVEVDAPDGIATRRVAKPYLLDLESINGSTINGEKVEPARYYELLTGDVVRFGLSSREYVVMNEAAAT